MATPDLKTLAISDVQFVELEKLARAQGRTVDDVLAEAVDRYIKDGKWQRLVNEARRRGQGVPPETIEAAVYTAITEYRKEHGR
jgi:hypothetical protein